MRRFVVVWLLVIFLFGCLCGLDEESERGSESLPAPEKASVASVEEAGPIPDEPISPNWLGKRLVDETDLPPRCEWFELVEFPRYRQWGCENEQGGLDAVLAYEGVVRVALLENPSEEVLAAVEEDTDCGVDEQEDGFAAECDGFEVLHMRDEEGAGILFALPGETARVIASAGTSFDTRFELGNFAYKLSHPRRRTRVGPDIAPTEAQSGAVFVVVNYTIENLGNETARALSSDFKLRDHQGRTFDASSEVGTALAMAGEADFILSELQPGLPREATMGFQVPESALEGPLVLIVPEKGFRGNDTVELGFTLYD